MYLSRIFLPWLPGQNPYNWHQQLWDLFPEESSRRNKIKREKEAKDEKAEFPAYFLFRIEKSTPGQGAVLLIQSPAKPIENGTIKIMKGPGELTYNNISESATVKFSLTANPTKMKSSDRNRVPHIGEQNLINWLNEKIAGFGKLDGEILVTPVHPIYFRKGNNAGKINPVTFEGKMKILEIAAFKKTAFAGIGPAKAFGCGLLLVKPV
ncbi:MAG TPA: type I-E CRISPR-associated protein Cas6/Cse3/CasE [Fibrobacteres bacterium]|jgi:CRISPR system Cascade subunit CasE|nr:type I-E CRISPR-associated protein Cas6/Cse3/CasE [Fibrobacterota bacterium]